MAETWYPVSPGLATVGHLSARTTREDLEKESGCAEAVRDHGRGVEMPSQGVPSQRWAGVSQEPQRQRLHDTVALPVPRVLGHPCLCGQSRMLALPSGLETIRFLQRHMMSLGIITQS